MNLLLELAVNLVEHLEAKKVITNRYLVALVEKCFGDGLTVEQRTVSRIKIAYCVAQAIVFQIGLCTDARMQTRSAKVVNTNICLHRASEDYPIALKWDGYGHQLAAQKDESRP